MSISVLKNLEECSIVLFTKILETKEYTRLIKGYDSEVEYTEEVKEQCAEMWTRLFDDYFILKNDGRAKNSIKKHSDGGKLYIKISMVQQALDVLVVIEKAINAKSKDTEKLIKLRQEVIRPILQVAPRFKINLLDGTDKWIIQLTKLHNSFTNELGLIEKRVDQVTEKAKSNIYQSLVSIQNVLGYAIGDFEKINVPYFVELEKSAISKANSMKEANKNKKR